MTPPTEYPISANLRTGFTTIPLSADQLSAAKNSLSGFLANLSKLTASSSGVQCKADALQGLSLADAYNLVAAARSYTRLGTVKGGWQGLKPAAPRPIAAGAGAAPQMEIKGLPVVPAAQCESILANVQYWSSAAVSYLDAMNNLIGQINSAIPQAELAAAQASGPQASLAAWNQLQSLATQIQGWLFQLTGSQLPALVRLFANLANQSMSGANATCADYAQILTANNQAQQAVVSAGNIAADPNLEWDSLVVAAYLTIPAPAPPPAPVPAVSFHPTVSVQTLGSSLTSLFSDRINISLSFDLDIPIAVTLSIDEADTQSLLTFLQNNDGGSVQGAVIGALAGIVLAAILAATQIGDPLTIGTFASAVFKLALSFQAMEIAAVIKEADDHAAGVSFHFGLVPGIISAIGTASPEAGGFTLTAAAAVILEANLAEELNTPGGVGSPWLDVFWITGN